jgi:hypothetical protein
MVERRFKLRCILHSPMNEGIDCTGGDVKHMGRDNGIIAGQSIGFRNCRAQYADPPGGHTPAVARGTINLVDLVVHDEQRRVG